MHRLNVVAIAILCLILAACGSSEPAEDEPLPTRFILPTLAPETTDLSVPASNDVTPESTIPVALTPTDPPPSPTSTVDPTDIPPELAEENSPTPGPSPTVPGAPEVTEPPPVAAASGDDAIQNFSALQPGDEVSLAGTLIVDAEQQQILLQDVLGGRIYLNATYETLSNLNNEFVTITGSVITVEGSDLLALVPGEEQTTVAAELTPEVDPQADILAAQRRTLDDTLPADLTALAAYDALLPLIDAEIDRYILATIYGTPSTSWRIEFYNEAENDTILYTVNRDGTVQADFTARSSLQPELPFMPLLRDQIQVDSDGVYAQLDLSDVPDFAMPEIRLWATEPDTYEWLVQSSTPVTIDATSQP